MVFQIGNNFGKLNKGKKRKPFSKEWLNKLSLAKKGKKFSIPHKLKISQALKGKPKSKEHIDKMKLIKGNKHWRFGTNLSEKLKKKISESNKGKHNHWGKLNPCWKGGITFFKSGIRGLDKYIEWRTKVFEKDNYTCQKCKSRNGNGKNVYLEAHHYPKSFSDIINNNNISSVIESLNCQELWDVNNGATLCFNCHQLTKKGKKYD